MKELPLKKLRNFGGKLGEELQALGCATAGQVAELPKQELEAHFGSQRAAAILAAVNGLSNDPVQVICGMFFTCPLPLSLSPHHSVLILLSQRGLLHLLKTNSHDALFDKYDIGSVRQWAKLK